MWKGIHPAHQRAFAAIPASAQYNESIRPAAQPSRMIRHEFA
jgi:hypothetical protein